MIPDLISKLSDISKKSRTIREMSFQGNKCHDHIEPKVITITTHVELTWASTEKQPRASSSQSTLYVLVYIQNKI